jgi:hypothetical protein
VCFVPITADQSETRLNHLSLSFLNFFISGYYVRFDLFERSSDFFCKLTVDALPGNQYGLMSLATYHLSILVLHCLIFCLKFLKHKPSCLTA